jgi:hypothetical protein
MELSTKARKEKHDALGLSESSVQLSYCLRRGCDRKAVGNRTAVADHGDVTTPTDDCGSPRATGAHRSSVLRPRASGLGPRASGLGPRTLYISFYSMRMHGSSSKMHEVSRPAWSNMNRSLACMVRDLVQRHRRRGGRHRRRGGPEQWKQAMFCDSCTVHSELETRGPRGGGSVAQFGSTSA